MGAILRDCVMLRNVGRGNDREDGQRWMLGLIKDAAEVWLAKNRMARLLCKGCVGVGRPVGWKDGREAMGTRSDEKGVSEVEGWEIEVDEW